MGSMAVTILAPGILTKLFKAGLISTATLCFGEESIVIEPRRKSDGALIGRDVFFYRDLSKIRLTRNTKNGTGHVRLYFRDGSKKIYTMNNGYEDAILSTAFSDRLAAYNSGVPEGERIEFGNPGT